MKVADDLFIELCLIFLTLSQMTNFRYFQTEKSFQDNNFKLDENGRKFSEWVENAVRKGEIALYEQFLLFALCFQKDLYCRHVKTRACFGKGLRLELIEGGRENYGYHHSSFSTMFSLFNCGLIV